MCNVSLDLEKIGDTYLYQVYKIMTPDTTMDHVL